MVQHKNFFRSQYPPTFNKIHHKGHAEHPLQMNFVVEEDITQASFPAILRQHANMRPFDASPLEPRQMIVSNVSHLKIKIKPSVNASAAMQAFVPKSTLHCKQMPKFCVKRSWKGYITCSLLSKLAKKNTVFLHAMQLVYVKLILWGHSTNFLKPCCAMSRLTKKSCNITKICG